MKNKTKKEIKKTDELYKEFWGTIEAACCFAADGNTPSALSAAIGAMNLSPENLPRLIEIYNKQTKDLELRYVEKPNRRLSFHFMPENEECLAVAACE